MYINEKQTQPIANPDLDEIMTLLFAAARSRGDKLLVLLDLDEIQSWGAMSDRGGLRTDDSVTATSRKSA